MRRVATLTRQIERVIFNLVNAILASKAEPLAELCRRYGVRRLDVFGSAMSTAFRAENSDFDFVADFYDAAPTLNYADRYLDFSSALETLLGRRVDVVSASALEGTRFARSIQEMRETLYAEPEPVAL